MRDVVILYYTILYYTVEGLLLVRLGLAGRVSGGLVVDTMMQLGESTPSSSLFHCRLDGRSRSFFRAAAKQRCSEALGIQNGNIGYTKIVYRIL